MRRSTSAWTGRPHETLLRGPGPELGPRHTHELEETGAQVQEHERIRILRVVWVNLDGRQVRASGIQIRRMR